MTWGLETSAGAIKSGGVLRRLTTPMKNSLVKQKPSQLEQISRGLIQLDWGNELGQMSAKP